MAGHFCGEVDATGEPTPKPPGKVGHCGSTEAETPLALEDGVWVCHADSSWMDEDH